MEQIVYGRLRVQILSEDIVRVERAGKNGFCDGDTFFIPSSAQYERTHAAFLQEGSVICFGRARILDGEEKRAAIALLSARYAPGRDGSAEIRQAWDRFLMVEIEFQFLSTL